jgi:hypothetical protein
LVLDLASHTRLPGQKSACFLKIESDGIRRIGPVVSPPYGGPFYLQCCSRSNLNFEHGLSNAAKTFQEFSGRDRFPSVSFRDRLQKLSFELWWNLKGFIRAPRS